MSRPQYNAFAIVIFVSITRLLSECHMLYDWDYNDVADTNTGFQSRSDSRDSSDDDADKNVLFNYDLGSEEQVRSRASSQKIADFLRKRSTVDRLSPEEARQLSETLKGLYAELRNHPDLMYQRLEAGSRRPDIPADHYTEKRSFRHLQSSPVCPARTEWRRLEQARDINDTLVQVLQPTDGTGPQWFYTTACNYEYASDYPQWSAEEDNCTKCCRGINRNRYHSQCITKRSFVMALVKKQHQQDYNWDWIQIDTGCACSISPA